MANIPPSTRLMKKRPVISRIGLYAFAALLVSAAVSSTPASSAPPETCSVKLTRLAQKIGASGSRQELVSIAPGVEKGWLSFACSHDLADPTILLSYPSEYPPESFYAALGD